MSSIRPGQHILYIMVHRWTKLDLEDEDGEEAEDISSLKEYLAIRMMEYPVCFVLGIRYSGHTFWQEQPETSGLFPTICYLV